MKTSTKCILIGLVILALCGITWFVGNQVESYVFNKDMIAYHQDSLQYEQLRDAKIKHIKDSVLSDWLATHDTIIGEIVKIKKTWKYGVVGTKTISKKTGNFECKNDTSKGKAICKPEIIDEEKDVFDWYLVYDTTWSHPYHSREEWIAELNALMDSSVQNIPTTIQYTGHKRDWLHYTYDDTFGFKTMSTACGLWLLILMAGWMIFLFGLALKISFWLDNVNE